ncbi:unnamed protein product [Aphanomyces euteiches]
MSKILNALAAERNAIVDGYIQRTQVQSDLEKFWAKLTAMIFLPQNPYPTAIDYFRELEASRNAIVAPPPGIVELLNMSYSTIRMASVDGIFGNSSLLKHINPQAVRRMVDLFDFEFFKQWNEDGYAVTSACALVNLAVFHGTSLIPKLNNEIELEHHVVIEGEKLERAIAIFATILAKDAYASQTSHATLSVGVWVSVPSFKKSDTDTKKLWTLDGIQTSRAAFVSAVKTAVAARTPCYISEFRCRQQMGYHGNIHAPYSAFVKVTRTFIMHFKPQTESKSMRSFASQPQRALCEGLFFTQDAVATLVSALRENSPTTLSWGEYTTPVLSSFTCGDLFVMSRALLHYSGVSQDSSKTLAQLCQITGGLPGELHALTETSANFKELLLLFIENPTGYGSCVPALSEAMGQYTYEVRQIARSHVHSLFAGLSKAIEAKLVHLVLPDDVDLTRFEYLIDQYKQIELLLVYVTQCLTRYILKTMHQDTVENPVYVVNQLVRTAQDEAKKRQQQIDKKAKTKKATETPEVTGKFVDPFEAPPFELGVSITREQEDAIENEIYPLEVSKQVTILQYIVDTRLDTAFETAMTSIVLNGMPSNFYPSIVEHLRVFGVRHVLSLEPKVAPIPFTIHGDFDQVIEHHGAFGTGLALAFVPDSVQNTVLQLKSWPICKVNYASPSANFTVQTGTSLYLRRWYRFYRGEPRHVDVVEHIQVETAHPSARKSIELFSDAVLQDVLNLADQKHMAVIWFRVASSQPERPHFKLNSVDMKRQREVVRIKIEEGVRQRHWIQACVYFQNKLVVKSYVLHLTDGAVKRCFAPTNLNFAHSQIYSTMADAENCQIHANNDSDIVDEGELDILDTYDDKLRESILKRDIASCEPSVRLLFKSHVLTLKRIEDQGQVFAAVCMTHLAEVKEELDKWLGQVQALVDLPEFHYALTIFGMWKASLERAIAAKVGGDVLKSIESIVGLSVVLRLTWQHDVHQIIQKA